jgi:hypothetical protein
MTNVLLKALDLAAKYNAVRKTDIHEAVNLHNELIMLERSNKNLVLTFHSDLIIPQLKEQA